MQFFKSKTRTFKRNKMLEFDLPYKSCDKIYIEENSIKSKKKANTADFLSCHNMELHGLF